MDLPFFQCSVSVACFLITYMIILVFDINNVKDRDFSGSGQFQSRTVTSVLSGIHVKVCVPAGTLQVPLISLWHPGVFCCG